MGAENRYATSLVETLAVRTRAGRSCLPAFKWILMAGVAACAQFSGANAACAPDPVGAGGTVTCTGADTDGFSSELSGVTVNVRDGAVVDGAPALPPGGSIRLEDDVTVTNDGTIIFNQADGTAAGWALRGGNRLTLTNNGLIQSNSTSTSTDPDTDSVAVLGGTGSVIHNTNSIVVDTTVNAYGIAAGGNATVTNSGRIDVSGRSVIGMRAQLNSNSDNSGTITVKATNAHFAAGMMDGSVTNSGIIEVDVVGMTKASNATVDPYAYGMYAGGGLSASNAGIIDVDVAASGMTGVGIAIESSPLFPGSIENSGDIAVAVEGVGSTGYGLRLSGNQSTAVNAGSIDVSGTTSGAGILAQEAYEELKITNTKSGTITSNDLGIEAYDFGIEINNAGKIDAKGHGIVIIDSALSAEALNMVTNSGVLISGKDAVGIGKGDLTLVNSGSIQGLLAVNAGDGKQTVTNSGTLEGDLILRGGDDTLTLQDGSLVTGDLNAGNGNDTMTSSGNGLFIGQITELETLTVTDGQLTLDIGSGSQIGATSVAGGVLYLTGSLATEMIVGKAGTLAGESAIKGDVINAGILSPGNLVGTLAVDGDYQQTATGSLLVQLGLTGSDTLSVTGVAALDGVLATALNGTDLAGLEGRSFTVLSADSVTGSLDTIGSVQQGFWTLNVMQSGTGVQVTVTDVNLPIGAMPSLLDPLSRGVKTAAPAPPERDGGIEIVTTLPPDLGGIVVQGENNTLPILEQKSLNYDNLGDWQSAAPSFVAGWSDMGARTHSAMMPKTGTGEFEGTTRGELAETGSPEALVVEGNVLLTADFASGLVNADFTEMEKIDSKGVTSAWVDFRARMSIADGTSTFAGTAGTDDGVWNGEARGGFYGDEGGMPGHAAGLWSMSSPLGQAIGGFMAKRQ